jgi:hypothetical protein
MFLHSWTLLAHEVRIGRIRGRINWTIVSRKSHESVAVDESTTKSGRMAAWLIDGDDEIRAGVRQGARGFTLTAAGLELSSAHQILSCIHPTRTHVRT